MPPSLNPYEPPNPVGTEPGWWARLVAKLKGPVRISRSVRDPTLQEFIEGTPAIFDGVVVFVDPHDSLNVYAAIALRENDSELIQRCLREVQRVLPQFFWEHSLFEQAVSGRMLVVCLIDDYLGLSEVADRVTVGPVKTLGFDDE